MVTDIRGSKQFERVAHNLSHLLTFRNAFVRITSMLERVFVAARSSRSRGTAMHAAASLSTYRRRPARLAGPGFRSAPAAREHRTGVTRMRAH